MHSQNASLTASLIPIPKSFPGLGHAVAPDGDGGDGGVRGSRVASNFPTNKIHSYETNPEQSFVHP